MATISARSPAHPPFSQESPLGLWKNTPNESKKHAEACAGLIRAAWGRIGIHCEPVLTRVAYPGSDREIYQVRLPDGWVYGLPPRAPAQVAGE